MSDNWIIQNLENALEVWNDKLSEIWQLITQSPQDFKGGSIWNVISNIHGALQAIGYASYENVLLSDTEYGKLRQEFPGDYQMRVERLSEYMASTGRSYKNHLATIRSWAKREKPKYNPADYTFEEGDSL